MIKTAEQNYYDLLGVEQSASLDEIKRAYFSKIRQYSNQTHPEEFKLLTKAYKTLMEADKKERYDHEIKDNGAYSKLLSLVEQALDTENYQSALYQLQELNKKYPDDLQVQQYMGMSYLGLSRLKDAVDLFNKLNSRYPNNETILFYLGITYSRMEKYTAAKAQFKLLTNLNPAEPNYQLQLSNALFHLQEYDLAIGVLQSYLSKKDSTIRDFELFSQWYLLSIYADRKASHKQVVDKILVLPKHEAERQELLGLFIDLCEELGNQDAAYKDLVKLIKDLNKPAIPEVSNWLGQAEARIRNDLIYFGDPQPQEQSYNNSYSSSNPDSYSSNQTEPSYDQGGSLVFAIILGIIASFILTPIGGIIIGVIWYFNAQWIKKVLSYLGCLLLVLVVIGIIIASNM